mmetsp:Transcript_12404/g.11238  ORF Transcript_12404/g.11238 Transcript_12404/m.11238 type:complete len:331 (+) Transcript_12404:162-1154(+)
MRKVFLSDSNDHILPEVIAVIKRGVFITESYLPRDIQLITVLSLLLKDPSKGRLAQVYTGEGKSLIMAMLAVILSLKGKKVDIVTSSKVLAIRDSHEKTNFYSLFGLSVGHNCSNSKVCYNSDIVYGDTLNYEGDILSDEYLKLNTRRKRPFHLVIIDEVDNLFIDNRLSRTELSTKTPGMSALTPVLQIIWIIVNNFYIYQESRNVLSDKLAILYLTRHQVVINQFIDTNIPKYLINYVKNNLKIWFNNSVKARYNYHIDAQYVIRHGRIHPVDYNSTGVLQMKTIWSDGLHQFIEMKENLIVTNMNLTTNFISNASFFRRYGVKWITG